MSVAGVVTVRLFVSSPGDVLLERDRVGRVVRRLNAELQGRVNIEEVRWEHQYYTADATFQAQIIDVGKCDVVVSIFWQRLGTPLPPDFERMANGRPYPSGTVYEVMKAIEARTKSDKGLPDILVYRKLADAAAPLIDRDRYQIDHEQRLAFLDFWQQWFFTTEGQFKAAYNTFETTDEFEGKLSQHLRSWLNDRGVVARTVKWPIGTKGSPFRGLEAFGPADEEIFFGRDREVERALERLGRTLATSGCAFLLLVGDSGSGKSSLARAGIVPKLQRGSLPTRVENWRYAEVRRGLGIAAAMAEALFAEGALPELCRGDFTTSSDLADLIRSSGKAAAASIRRALDRVGIELQQKLGSEAAVEVGLILLLDQFESFLADGSIEAIAQALSELAHCRRTIVVATMRSDAYAALTRVPALLALKEAGEVLDVATPEPAAIADIVRRPAQLAGLAFGSDPETGDSLDDIIVRSATGRDALPLVEFALSRLYAQMLERLARRGVSASLASADDRELAYSDYAAFGGIGGAIAEAAERAFAAMGSAAQAALPRLLRALAQASDAPLGAAPSSGLCLTEAHWEDATRDQGADTLVRALIDARILVVSGTAPGERRVHLAHEAVLRSWPRAREIVEAHANFFRIRADVAAAEQRWKRQQRIAGGRAGEAFLLVPGVPLAEAEDMQRRFADELSPDLLAFIERSSARAKQQVRRLIAAVVIFAITAAGAIGAAGLAWIARNQAAANALLAQKNAETASANEVLAQRNADAALKNFHRAADQAEALVITLADKLKFDSGVTREALKSILAEGQRQIDSLAAQDPGDHYVAQVRAKAIANIAGNYFDLGDIAAAKALLTGCLEDVRTRPRESWDSMDRHVAALCLTAGSKLATAEGKTDAAIDMAEHALELASENAKDATNPIWVRNLGVALIDVGDLLAGAGDFEKAEKCYKQALDLRRQLAQQQSDVQTREDLQLALDRVGKIADLRGRGEQALAAYREALETLQKLDSNAPPNTMRTENLSVAYAKVGLVLARAGRNLEAIDYYRPCVDIRRQLVARDNTNWRWRTLLAEAINGLGLVLARAGRPDEGLPLLTDAVDRYQEIVQHDANNAASRRALAMTLSTYAGAIMARDRRLALDAAHEALAIFRTLASGNPQPSALLDVAMSLLIVADAGEETRKNYEDAYSIYRSLDDRGALPPGTKAMLPNLKIYIDNLPAP
jgi:tetratricopeptide (TPR) repeat protein